MSVALHSLNVFDLHTPGTRFRRLIAPQTFAARRPNDTIALTSAASVRHMHADIDEIMGVAPLDDVLDDDDDDSIVDPPCFFLTLDNGSQSSSGGQQQLLRVYLQPLEMVYNPYCIEALIKMVFFLKKLLVIFVNFFYEIHKCRWILVQLMFSHLSVMLPDIVWNNEQECFLK